MIIDRDEIESVLDYHFPRVINVERGLENDAQAAARKEFERKLKLAWDEEREVAIKKCVDVLSRRIKERA
jgi:hypothetical protein